MSTNSYELRFVNGLSGDPAVYLFFPTWSESLLFDLGGLEPMTNRELLKVRQAFVSHCHIDHFIGFDRLLRVNVPHFRNVRVTGPKGFIENVRGKLNGYCWNLLEGDQVSFTAQEVHADGTLLRADLLSSEKFKPTKEEREGPSHDGIVTVSELSDGAMMNAIVLDHGTDSLAYRLDMPQRYRVKIDELDRFGLKPGSWIKDVQRAMNQKQMDALIEIDGQEFMIADLAAAVMEEHVKHSIGYVTDIVFDRENLERARRLLKDVTVLICEASFRDEDAYRAFSKKHLSTRQAALLAAYVGARRLEPFHFSGIYGGEDDVSREEASKFFATFSELSENELNAAIEKELQRAKTS